jgi:hypothetical protein
MVAGFNDIAQQFGNVGTQLQNAATQLSGLTVQHQVAPIRVECIFNGLSILKELEMGMSKIAERVVTKQIDTMLDQKFGMGKMV